MTSPDWKRVIGVLGGLGPHAHIEFESLLLSATADALGRPPRDQDYPPWLVSSMPGTPDRTRAILEGGESPLEALVRSAARLASADFAVIPCNSAHAFLPELQARVSLPFLDMVESCAERAVELAGRDGVIGILAATGTLRSGLYARAVATIAPDVRVVSPLDLTDGETLQKELVMAPIFDEDGIKAGAFKHPERREALAEPMREATRRLADAGALVVLTACTEIPLVLGRERVDETPLLDPMAVAASRAVDIALGREPLPAARAMTGA